VKNRLVSFLALLALLAQAPPAPLDDAPGIEPLPASASIPASVCSLRARVSSRSTSDLFICADSSQDEDSSDIDEVGIPFLEAASAETVAGPAPTFGRLLPAAAPPAFSRLDSAALFSRPPPFL
jgi:hypothetical protein